MRRADIGAGVLLAVLGLLTIFVIVPDQISDSSDVGIAPDVYPLTLLWLVAGLSLVLAVGRLVRRRSLEDRVCMLPADWKFIVAASVFLAGAFVLIDALGMRLGGPLVIAALMVAMGDWPAHRLRVVLVSVLAPLALYYIFWKVFYVPLP